MQSTSSTSSSQRYFGIALLAALLAGVYALGRSQTGHAEAAEGAPTQARVASAPASAIQVLAPVPVAKPHPPSAQKAMAEPASPSANPPKPVAVLCEECATVTSVHQVQQAGQASGLGAVGGAVLGGLLGNQIGGGNGKKLATVGGAAAGGYFGNEMEKKHKSHTLWVVRVTFADNSSRSYELAHDPQLRAKDVVSVRDGELIKQ